jgi:hypothetical protein
MRQGAAMSNKSTDIQWSRIQLDDVAVLLRTHGMEKLANHLDAIREDLQLSYDGRSHNKKPHPRRTRRPAGAVTAAPG